jgi:serine/threonine protein kinase
MPMLCPVCRTANPETARACSACAAPLDAQAAEAPTHLLPPGTRLQGGAYTIGKVLGQGGFGITYLGSETAAGKAVAIKEFFPHGSLRQGSRVLPGSGMSSQDFNTALARFLDEAQVLERFTHPGIVTVYADFAEKVLGNIVNWEFVAQNLDGQGLSRADQAG